MFSPSLGNGLILAVSLGLLSTAGCKPSYEGPQRIAVSGSVSFDGKAIDQGIINLIPLTDGKRKASAVIENGTYRIPEPKGPNPGKHMVEIHWLKPTGRKTINQGDPGGPSMIDETAEVIPAKYNTQTNIQVEITRERNKHDFSLTSR